MKAIYAIINLITGDRSIGSTVSFNKRKQQHFKSLKDNKHHSVVLQRAWEKYGEKNFKFIVLEEIKEKENLLIREQWWIDNTNSIYNICKIAGNALGTKRSLESREKMRKSHLGVKHPEWRRKLKSVSQGGENHWTKKKKYPEAGKQKIRESIKKLYKKGWQHPSKKTILQIDKNNNLIKEWDSLANAARNLNISYTAISNCIRGKTKTCLGFIWKFKK